MRFALLVLCMVGPSLLSATSLPPRPWDIIKPVAHGKYLYVQLDETAKDQGKRQSVDFPWTQSGLYSPTDPEQPLWTADLGVLPWHGGGELIVTDDGLTAAVLNSSERPSISFYREGRRLRAWDLAGPAHKPHRSETNWPGVRTSFARWDHFDNFVRVSCRTGDRYTFLLETGELVRRLYAAQLQPTPGELEAFESTLAGGETDDLPPDEGSVPDTSKDAWLDRVPPGGEAFVARDGAVRVVRVVQDQPGDSYTAAFDAAGEELWSISGEFPRPVFLDDVEAGLVLGRTELPGGGHFPLVVTGDGTACALGVYSLDSRATSIRVFVRGEETTLDLPSTYSGNLKSGGVELTAIDSQRVIVELGYGTGWWERYEVDVGAATLVHTTNFPDETADEGSHGHSSGSWNWLGVLVPLAAMAFMVLLLGFFIGRVTLRS